MLWFKRKPLHERLAEEGGLPLSEEEEVSEPPEGPLLPEPKYRDSWLAHGDSSAFLLSPDEYEAHVVVEAPEIGGREVEFVALSDGSLIVGEAEGEASLDPLADAIERELTRPYQATGVRQGSGQWFVRARRIDLVELPGVERDELQLTVYEGQWTATTEGDLRPLEDLAAGKGFDSYVARATRLEGDLWEVQVTPL